MSEKKSEIEEEKVKKHTHPHEPAEKVEHAHKEPAEKVEHPHEPAEKVEHPHEPAEKVEHAHKEPAAVQEKENKETDVAEKKQTKKASPKAKKKPKKSGAIIARGKRKESIARARVKVGKGQFRVNGSTVNAIQNRYLRELILEPVKLAGEKALLVDISASSYGGGVMGQAQAVRTAVARGLVEYFEDDSLKQTYLERDRSLLIEDPRRVEPKKYRGPKSRARYQKSYR